MTIAENLVADDLTIDANGNLVIPDTAPVRDLRAEFARIKALAIQRNELSAIISLAMDRAEEKLDDIAAQFGLPENKEVAIAVGWDECSDVAYAAD